MNDPRRASLAWLVGCTGAAIVVACATGGWSVAAGTVISGIIANQAATYIPAIIRKKPEPDEWLANGHLSDLAAWTIAGILRQEAENTSEPLAVRRAGDRVWKNGSGILQRYGTTLGNLSPDALPADLLRRPQDLHKAEVGDLSDWEDIVRFFATEHEGNTSTCGLQPETVTRLAGVLQKRFLGELLNVAAKHPEHATKVTHLLLGEGFADLKAELAAIRDHQDPVLYVPGPRTWQRYNFATRHIQFSGRRQEYDEFHAFLGGEPGFAWWRLTGTGGAGKSRFALEAVKEAQRNGWIAGFLDITDPDNTARFLNWTPDRDAFIVVDYGLDRPEQTARALRHLYQSVPNDVRIRVLVIARESGRARWDLLGKSGLMANVWSRLHAPAGDGDPVDRPGSQLSLAPMAEAELTDLCRLSWKANGYGTEFPEAEALAGIRRLTGFGGDLPLYAQMAAEMLHAGRTFASKGDLIGWVVDREFDRWKAASDDPKLHNLAFYACIVGDASLAEAQAREVTARATDTSLPELFPSDLVTTATQPFGGQSGDHLPALTPDVLAEWYVLCRLRDPERYAVRTSAQTHALAIWELATTHERFDPFLYRLAQSFPGETEGTPVWKGLQDERRVFIFALKLEAKTEDGDDLSLENFVCLSTLFSAATPESGTLLSKIIVRIIANEKIEVKHVGILLNLLRIFTEENSHSRLEYSKALLNSINTSLCESSEEADRRLNELSNIAEEGLFESITYAKAIVNSLVPALCDDSNQADERLARLSDLVEVGELDATFAAIGYLKAACTLGYQSKVNKYLIAYEEILYTELVDQHDGAFVYWRQRAARMYGPL